MSTTLPSERLVGKVVDMEPLSARTLPDLVRAGAEHHGDREAIVDGPVRLTYAGLAEEVARFAEPLPPGVSARATGSRCGRRTRGGGSSRRSGSSPRVVSSSR
ncbi:hypothetical protein GCM10027610_048910 [Dactylosporangium cerinum]